MTLIGSAEIIAGIAVLMLSGFLIWVFRVVPLGASGGQASVMRVTLIPVFILLLWACGIALILVGAGIGLK